MICPSCNTSIADGLTECPQCHNQLQAVRQSTFFHRVLPCVILLEALVIAILCFTMLPKWEAETFGSRSVAVEYFSSIVNGNETHAYEMLDLEDDLMINKQTFSTYCRNLGILGSTQYQVDVLDFSALVSYSSDGTLFDTIEIPLLKTGSKYFNFFELWKINSSKLIATSCVFRIPLNATLMIDSIAIPSDYISEMPEEAEANPYQNVLVTYTIPRLFAGRHQITVSRPGYQSFCADISASTYSDFCCDQLYLTETSMDLLSAQSCTDLQSLFSHILVGDAFETVSDLFCGTTSQMDQFDNSYRELCSLYNTDDAPTQIDFTDLTSEVDPETGVVILSGICKVSFFSQGHLDLCPQPHFVEYAFQTSFQYINVNGQWQLHSMPAFPIYY